MTDMTFALTRIKYQFRLPTWVAYLGHSDWNEYIEAVCSLDDDNTEFNPDNENLVVTCFHEAQTPEQYAKIRQKISDILVRFAPRAG